MLCCVQVGQTPPPTDDWYIQSSVVDLSDPKPPPVAAHAMVNTQSVAVAARLPALASSSLSAIVATVAVIILLYDLVLGACTCSN